MRDMPLHARWATATSSVGRVLVALSERGICGVMLGEDDEVLKSELRARFPHAELLPGGAEADAAARFVANVVDRPGGTPPHPLPFPLDLRGTPFQQGIWDVLRGIPAGETVSYAELAARAGRPRAIRAAAAACAANPVAVLVPCHRVIGRGGALTGYRWGVERKRALLRREGAYATVPTASAKAPSVNHSPSFSPAAENIARTLA